jgi:hypothetical protein
MVMGGVLLFVGGLKIDTNYREIKYVYKITCHIF